MKVLGIDPGKDGAFAVVERGNLIICETFPKFGGEVIFKKLFERFQALSLTLDLVVIENLQAIMGSSARATFSFGRSFQMALDAASMTNKPIHLVKPVVWQGRVFNGHTQIKKKNKRGVMIRDTKAMAKACAHQLFPNESFLASERCTTPHDGMIDAAMIAYYGSVLMKESENVSN